MSEPTPEQVVAELRGYSNRSGASEYEHEVYGRAADLIESLLLDKRFQSRAIVALAPYVRRLGSDEELNLLQAAMEAADGQAE